MNLKFKNTIVTTIFICSPIIGILATMFGVNNIRNYYSFYIFILVFLLLSIALGIVTYPIIQPYIKTKGEEEGTNSVFVDRLFIILLFLGLFINTGYFINSRFSKLRTIGYFTVFNKYKDESTARYHMNKYYIYVNVKEDFVELSTNPDYWQIVAIGGQIKLSLYDSPFGFDYIVITDEEKQLN